MCEQITIKTHLNFNFWNFISILKMSLDESLLNLYLTFLPENIEKIISSQET
jgi:hypothetical protein